LTIKDARQQARRLTLRPRAPAPQSAPADEAEPEIVVRDLWHSYDGHPALKGVSLTIRQGEFVAIMGRNGSGKTTLLKHLVGLLQPQRGSVLVRGLDTRQTALEQLVNLVGYVPQNPNALLFADTVAQELAFTRRSHGLPEGDAGGLLRTLGIAGQADRYPRDLSVGERQRVALATILAAEPEIIMMDEPTRGVDYAQKEALAQFLRGQRERGRTVILSTHDVELAASAVERVVILGDGEVVVDGPTRQVMSQSMVFSSQVNKLLRDERYLTVADVLQDRQD
jgi:energy-coupling factor transport system ATP-binding protein